MAPDTRTTEIKRLEDSIESAKREANSKYDQLVNLMKDQGQRWDHTTNNHEA
jgi:predicted  nucleic acid-binding Zn-ribbon protein